MHMTSTPVPTKEALSAWERHADRGKRLDEQGETKKWEAAEEFKKSHEAGASFDQIGRRVRLSHTYVRLMVRALETKVSTDERFADAYARVRSESRRGAPTPLSNEPPDQQTEAQIAGQVAQTMASPQKAAAARQNLADVVNDLMKWERKLDRWLSPMVDLEWPSTTLGHAVAQAESVRDKLLQLERKLAPQQPPQPPGMSKGPPGLRMKDADEALRKIAGEKTTKAA